MSGAPRELLDRFARPGRLQWIGIRPGRGEPLRPLQQAQLQAGRGLAGDRYAASGNAGARQVSLMQAEHLAVIDALASRPLSDVGLLRRNLIVSGINLRALRNSRFCIGGALLEGSGDCDPCARMEDVLGPGGYNVLRGHGGILARVLEGGPIQLGDAVRYAGASLPVDVDGEALQLHTPLGCPELVLQILDPGATRPTASVAPPAWATYSRCAATLARYVLDHPERVRGAAVVELGAGSGLVSIAAARAGARQVLAVDADPRARAACAANAARNHVDVATASEPPEDTWEVLVAARGGSLGAAERAQLERWRRSGRSVLVALPEHADTLNGWTLLTQLDVPEASGDAGPGDAIRLYLAGSER